MTKQEYIFAKKIITSYLSETKEIQEIIQKCINWSKECEDDEFVMDLFVDILEKG